MSAGNVTTERRGHVLLMGLDRAAKRNAFDLAMYHALAAAYGELERDGELRCGLLFAHGDHFTAGLDLVAWAPYFQSGQYPPLPAGAVDPLGLEESNRVAKPVVMAVQGICLTLGIELLLASDVRVAASDTRFAQIEIKRGIYPVGGATVRFIQEAGWGNAMRYLLTGDEFDAAEAYRIGLIQQVVEPGRQLEAALQIAESIAAQAPLGVYASLKSARLARARGEPAALARLLPDLAPLMGSEDVQEGLQSFIERRPAAFKGR
ncbi:MAG: crotonase/enoyl-CoA hydratase family protein [Chloroflexi bacterium]|nr:crotonase/enoyl-CoA hydratase family protein [Chloroflexota bacterium]MCI0581101.1 crotonase/enoyl-CoA hydratase family protein [Chloroflexota bacterium]MCI0649850.1 crotonase/enoyl-CoA hydratase family protein [Chloroflexota bacterium]MCI0731341.1 crotonase/enoyl-CoA hydratase family protein [Chloroflexota bacterium]